MTGGAAPSGLVTAKESVRHCPVADTGTCLVAALLAGTGETAPLLATLRVTVSVAALGPVRTKVSKSRRSCRIKEQTKCT